MNGLSQNVSLVRTQIVQSLEEQLKLILPPNQPISPSVSELISESLRNVNTESVEDDFQIIVTKIWELLSLYRGNRSQAYEYICRHLSTFISTFSNSSDPCLCVYSPSESKKQLTPPPMEAIIDLWYMHPWDQYLLWQYNVEERSVRDIQKLTSVSKTLIARDLRNIHGYSEKKHFQGL